MPAYLIATYNIADPETYAKYNPGSLGVIMKTIGKHGGQVLIAGHDCVRLAGDEKDVKIMIKFPSSDAAIAWDDDPEYAEVKGLRLSSTKDIDCYIIDEFVPPQS